jgi:cysteine-rich repeat protein
MTMKNSTLNLLSILCGTTLFAGAGACDGPDAPEGTTMVSVKTAHQPTPSASNDLQAPRPPSRSLVIVCDVWVQDCPEAEKCIYVADVGTQCVDVTGVDLPGDACTSDEDSCVKGALCRDINPEGVGTCVAQCTGTPDAVFCPQMTGAPVTCTIANDGLLNLCIVGSLCGDGVVEGDEECEDGNGLDGDGCSSTCTVETVCGDGVVEGAEQCDDGNSDDGDRCSNACVVQACAAGDVKGLWVWNDYVNLANDAADAAELLDFARSKGVTRLFFDVWDEEAGATLTATSAGRQTLAGLIADADARCLEVDLLIGPKGDTAHSEMQGWMDDGGSVAAAIAFAEDAVEFTAGLSGPKPVGIHLDIEPSHAPDEDNDMPGVVARLIDRLYAITDAFAAAQAQDGTTLRINADANVWLQHHNITRGGATKAAHVWLLDRLDATFMDYVDNSASLIDYISTEMTYAAGLTDRQVIVGVETMRPVLDGWGEWSLDPSATFFEEGEAALGGALDAVVDHYANNPSFVGTAIHYYDSLRRLSPGPMRLAIPSYIYPDTAWNPGSDWFPALDSVGPGGILMINPDSGPGVAVNPDYVAITAAIKGEGIFALGYVSTAYGDRSKAAVIADINKYYDWYRPSGIFLDEAPGIGSCAAKRQHYLDLATAIRAQDGSALVVANPGTDTCASYLDFIDVLVTFEDSAVAYANYTPPAWTAEHAPTRFWHLVHDAGQLGSLVTTAAQRNAGWVYITDDLYQDDPWDNLASYVADEAAQVAAVVLP